MEQATTEATIFAKLHAKLEVNICGSQSEDKQVHGMVFNLDAPLHLIIDAPEDCGGYYYKMGDLHQTANYASYGDSEKGEKYGYFFENRRQLEKFYKAVEATGLQFDEKSGLKALTVDADEICALRDKVKEKQYGRSR